MLVVRPQLLSGKNVLIVCHGFVVRVLLAYLNNLTPLQWRKAMILETKHENSILTVPNAVPVFYNYTDKGMEEIDRKSVTEAYNTTSRL